MGVSGADSLLRSHPTSSFAHSREDVPQPSKSKSLPRSMRLEQEEETESTSGVRRTRGYPSDGEKVGGMAGEGTGRVGGEGGKTTGEDWVAWVKERSLLQLDENSVTSSQRHPREGWREGEKRETLENGISDDSAATPCSPVHFQNTTPPSSLASPRARRPTFEPCPPLDHGFSLSQGTSLPHSPPSLPHPQRGRKMNGAHPHINFSLSQEAYMSSPLYIRKPAFKESLAATSRKQPRDRTLSEGRRPCQSPLPHDLTPSHNSHPHPLSDSEPEQMLARSQPQSAFCKPPHPLPVYRQLSHPARLVPPVHYHLPRNQRDIATTTETTHSQHSPPHVSPPQQSPPALPTSSRLPPSFNPPPPPSSHPPTLPPSHSRSHHPHSDTNPTSIRPPPHPMGVATTGMGVANRRSHTLQDNPAQHQEEEEEVEEETEEEEEEIEGGEERCYTSLGPEQLYKLLLKMADPKCTMTKLE